MRFVFSRHILLAVLVFVVCCTTRHTAAERAAAPAYQVVEGKLDGALYTVLKPATWNGKLLLVCRGLSDADLPLAVDLRATDEPFRTLLAAGWLVAGTSYRRNGPIVRDALADVRALHAHVVATYGAPKRTLLLGSSMGCAIAARLAEADPKAFAGALLLGAGVELREPADLAPLSYAAAVPLLFMTNQSEVDSAAAYVEQATANHAATALWTVARNGHVKFTNGEYLAAVTALDQWVDGGKIETEKKLVIPAPEPASTAKLVDGGVQGTVREVGTDFGNLETTLVAADFHKLGLEQKSQFLLVAGAQSFTVTYADTYTDVPTGDWVCFLDADGYYRIAICFGNAAKTANLKVGDPIMIKKK